MIVVVRLQKKRRKHGRIYNKGNTEEDLVVAEVTIEEEVYSKNIS